MATAPISNYLPRSMWARATALACLLLALALVGVGAWRVFTPGATPLIGGAFSLTDQFGKTRTDADFRGQYLLVFFGFTHCPDICPTTLFDMSQLLRKLGPEADRTGALFITVDPERDTPTVMKDYLSNFDPHLRGLTGDQASIDAAIRGYRVYAKKVPLQGGDYTMDHTAVVYLMDKTGRFVAPFNMKRRPQEAAADLERYY